MRAISHMHFSPFNECKIILFDIHSVFTQWISVQNRRLVSLAPIFIFTFFLSLHSKYLSLVRHFSVQVQVDVQNRYNSAKYLNTIFTHIAALWMCRDVRLHRIRRLQIAQKILFHFSCANEIRKIEKKTFSLHSNASVVCCVCMKWTKIDSNWKFIYEPMDVAFTFPFVDVAVVAVVVVVVVVGWWYAKHLARRLECLFWTHLNAFF